MCLEFYSLIKGDKFPKFHTTSSLIVIEELNVKILHDPGFIYDKESLKTSLEVLEISPSEITHIILSHWHIDHCGNVSDFENAEIILSIESFESIKTAVYGILQSQKSDNKIDFLVNYFSKEIQRKNEMDELEGNYSKMRAFSNVVLRNSHDWEYILNSPNVRLIKESHFELFYPFINIEKVSAHTKGDLIVRIKDKNNNILLLGDIIPYFSEELSFPMLTEDKKSFKSTLEKIYEEECIVIPGHGEAFNSKSIKIPEYINIKD